MKRLVEAARAGDRTALAELTTRSLPSVYHLVSGVLGDRAEVDDIVQECMSGSWTSRCSASITGSDAAKRSTRMPGDVARG